MAQYSPFIAVDLDAMDEETIGFTPEQWEIVADAHRNVGLMRAAVIALRFADENPGPDGKIYKVIHPMFASRARTFVLLADPTFRG